MEQNSACVFPCGTIIICVCVCVHLDYYPFTCVLPCLFLPVSFSSEAYCPLLLQLQSWQQHHNTHLLSHLLNFLCCTQEESCRRHTARLHRWSKEEKNHDRRLLVQAEGLQCMVITALATSSCPPGWKGGGADLRVCLEQAQALEVLSLMMITMTMNW